MKKEKERGREGRCGVKEDKKKKEEKEREKEEEEAKGDRCKE